jgi:nucleoside-diphosphate-sugar epimerase
MEVAALVCRLTATTTTVQHVTKPVDDPVRRQPDVALARQLLDWRPGVQLEEGLTRTIPAFREELGMSD